MDMNNKPKQTFSLDHNTMNTLVNMMRVMVRQELQSSKSPKPNNSQQKPLQVNQQKPNFSKAVSIRDEIRAIVREELQALKNANSEVRKTVLVQNKPQQVQQTKPQQNSPKPVQVQNKPVQNFSKPIQNIPKQNVIRITSVEQLATHLQNAINNQLQQKQQILGKPVQKNNVQVKVIQQQKPVQVNQQKQVQQNQNKTAPQNQIQNKIPNKQTQQTKPQVKIIPNTIRPNVQQNNSKPVQVQSQTQQNLKVGLNPGNKRGESQNNPVLQQQANDILSKMASFKKSVQNNQQKK